MDKLPLHEWLVNLLEVPSKDPGLIERTACAYCKWRDVPEDKPPCCECKLNLGNWEFDDKE